MTKVISYNNKNKMVQISGAVILTALVFAFTVPIFRSGGRTNLTFFEFIINHTIWGPSIEYVPSEDYLKELS